MEFRILGPLEVVEDGRTLDLRGKNQRALLAMLLLDANRPVSSDRLIEALWEDDPPETAQKAVQVIVSQLRKQLGRERLETQPSGYRLRVEPGELDVDRFRGLAAQGMHAEALALWRGPPLGDFTNRRFAQPEIAHLEELYLACREEQLERALEEGEHVAVIGELEALVRAQPLRERSRALLMLALYRSGRQADALEAYQAGRLLLDEELGLEPGEPLKQLQRSILEHDPELDVPTDRAEAPEQPPAVATPPPAHEVRKTVTVLVADPTPVAARLDPELLRGAMARSVEELREVVERHGGTVGSLSPGPVTVIFGVPVVHEDDALRAVRAAAELRDRLSAVNLALRIGVCTGEVIARDGDVVGVAVGRAGTLQQSARPGEILLAAETQRLVRDAVLTEPAEEDVDGPVFRLLAIVPGSTGYPRRFESPMIGRSRERRRLFDAFQQAVSDQSCQLFTILGAAGVGKSRLVREFLGDLGSDALIARGRCLPYGVGITYWPVTEVVREAAGVGESDTLEQSRDKLARQLEGEDDADVISARVAELTGLAEASWPVDEGFWAVRTFFEALARRSPLVLVFDDIHWGEATFLDLIEHIADWTHAVPILLVCIARPELLDVRPGWGGGKLNATAVLLEPLSELESSALIDNLSSGIDAHTRRRVIEASEGNPLFVEEMVALESDHADGSIEVPPTIHALLAARIDRLTDQERWTVECASVEGKVFHQGSVAELLPEPFAATLPMTLASLVRKELIRPDRALFAGQRAFRFRHLLLRDAAYDSVPKAVRARLHERYAAWLELHAATRLVEYEEIIGYHLEQVFLYRSELGTLDAASQHVGRRAAARLGAAGRRAFGRSDSSAAVNLISRAAALLPADDPARIDLVPNVRVVQGMSADLTWADEILKETLETGDAQLEPHALVQRGFLRLFGEPQVTPDELVEVAERALPIFEASGDELGQARAWRLVAQARYLGRSAAGCVEASERALVHARRARDPFELKEIIEWLAVALALGPAPASDADRRCEELLRDAAGDIFLEVTILAVRAFLQAMQGRDPEARQLLAQARQAATSEAYLHRVPYFAIHVAHVELFAANPAAAERELRAAGRVLEELGEQTNYSTTTAQLAVALCNQERFAEAEEFTASSEHAARPNDVMANVMWRYARATALDGLGNAEAAEALARASVAFAEESDFVNVHGDALLVLAGILQRGARHDEAVPLLERAVGLFEQKEHGVGVARARAQLKPVDLAANEA
jgi:DNA-binding SARP family transcriptional activator/tetratricopeptide (TPR) repeat protein